MPDAPTTVRLRLPAGKSLALGGAECVPDGEGCITVLVAHVAEAERHGCTPAPPAARTAEAAAESGEDAESAEAPKRRGRKA